PAEQWNPATGQWKTLASMQITRQYHSTALLLPDGRVLSAGGGICGTCDAVGYLAKNAEIFSPPYLFQADGTLAPRPTIDSAPSTPPYGASMTIATGNPASTRKVALVRLGAVTHSDNMEQRYIPLSYTAGATTLTATAPASANIAPPGYYMLFIIDANGVPPVARPGRLPPPPPPPPAPPPHPPDGDAEAADRRSDVHGARDGESRGNSVRLRRNGDEGRVLQRRGEARRGHDRALHVQLEPRLSRDIHTHRPCHRRRRSSHNER